MEIFLVLITLIGCTLETVYGLSIIYEPNNIEVSDSATSISNFTMTCIIDQENDIHRLIGLQLSRKFSDNSTESLAYINPFVHGGGPELSPSTGWDRKGAVLGGGHDSSSPKLTRLSLTVLKSQLRSTDAGVYMCEIAYWTAINDFSKVTDGKFLHVFELKAHSLAVYGVAGALGLSLLVNFVLIAYTLNRKRSGTKCDGNGIEPAPCSLPERSYQLLRLDYVNADADNMYTDIIQDL